MPYSPRPRAVPAAIALLATLLGTSAARAQQAPPVAIATATTDAIVQEVTLSGGLTSPRRASVAPEVEGRVAGVIAESGDTVAAGDPLLRLDDTLDTIELRQADASLQEARARLADARRRLHEARDLAARDTIGQSELETRRAEVQQLEAVLARRNAERAFRAEMVDRHTLHAPFAGVINRRMAEMGERVGPDEPVYELVSIDHLWLELAVPQRYFGAVTPGTPVRIHVDARPNAPIEAAVDTVIPVSDGSSRTFHARVDVDNAARTLTPGMSARATLRIDTGRQGVVIPKDALIRYPDGRTVVWVAEGDGATRTVHERRVLTGLDFDQRVSIREGLTAGTPIVVEGNEALQDGQTVRLAGSE